MAIGRRRTHRDAPASPAHALIQNNFGGMIRAHLLAQGGGCHAAANPGVLLGRKEDRNYRIPDLGVTCSPLVRGEPALPNPILLIETLFPGNQTETWLNVWAFTTIQSVREILVIRADAPGAQVLRRNPEGGWPILPAAIDGGTAMLECIGFRMPLNDVYAGTWLTMPPG